MLEIRETEARKRTQGSRVGKPVKSRCWNGGIWPILASVSAGLLLFRWPYRRRWFLVPVAARLDVVNIRDGRLLSGSRTTIRAMSFSSKVSR